MYTDSFEKRTIIFVFGSNLAGRHGKGAAYHAMRYKGAVYGVGVGHHGQSYAIPTKDRNLTVMPLEAIKPYICDFMDYARENPDLIFNLTPIGTGLAGYSKLEMLKLITSFRIPENVLFSSRWFQE